MFAARRVVVRRADSSCGSLCEGSCGQCTWPQAAACAVQRCNSQACVSVGCTLLHSACLRQALRTLPPFSQLCPGISLPASRSVQPHDIFPASASAPAFFISAGTRAGCRCPTWLPCTSRVTPCWTRTSHTHSTLTVSGGGLLLYCCCKPLRMLSEGGCAVSICLSAVLPLLDCAAMPGTARWWECTEKTTSAWRHGLLDLTLSCCPPSPSHLVCASMRCRDQQGL